jgi:hypothetical protein
VVCKPIIADAQLLRVKISAAYRSDKLSDAAQAFLMTARLHADSVAP